MGERLDKDLFPLKGVSEYLLNLLQLLLYIEFSLNILPSVIISNDIVVVNFKLVGDGAKVKLEDVDLS